MMLLPYKSRHLLRKKSVFFARTGRSVIQFYNKLAAVYWLPMFWPRRRPGTHDTHFVSMSGPTVHPYTVPERSYIGTQIREAFQIFPSFRLFSATKKPKADS